MRQELRGTACIFEGCARIEGGIPCFGCGLARGVRLADRPDAPGGWRRDGSAFPLALHGQTHREVTSPPVAVPARPARSCPREGPRSGLATGRFAPGPPPLLAAAGCPNGAGEHRSSGRLPSRPMDGTANRTLPPDARVRMGSVSPLCQALRLESRHWIDESFDHGYIGVARAGERNSALSGVGGMPGSMVAKADSLRNPDPALCAKPRPNAPLIAGCRWTPLPPSSLWMTTLPS